MMPRPISGSDPTGSATRLVIIIPTRNRGDYAQTTVESILRDAVDLPVSVVVSDNSDDTRSVDGLTDYIRRIAAPDVPAPPVKYLRASGDLDMSDHWSWALAQVESGPFSHFLYLTDRSVVNRRGLKDLLATIDTNPTSLISFGTNTIHDLSTPVSLERAEYSHEVVTVASDRLLALVAESIMSIALPRMLNSVVPRALLDGLRREFGDPFGSTAPDYHFCFRALAIVPRITYFDRDVISLHGLTRSNGMSTTTGRLSADARDFLDREERLGRWAPDRFGGDITTTYRVILDEYRMAASVAKGHQHTDFRPYNQGAYRRAFAIETDGFVEGSLKTSNQDALRRQGVEFSSVASKRRSIARVIAYIRFLGPRDSAPLLLERLRPSKHPIFDTSGEALRYVQESSFAPRPSRGRLDYLTQGS